MILVVAEQQRGKLHRASWEAVAAAQELAGDQPIEAIVLGASPADAASELGQAAVAAVHVIDSPLLEPYTPDAYTDALQKAIDQLEPTHVVLPHTYRTRDFAPKLAARLDRAADHRLRRHQARRQADVPAACVSRQARRRSGGRGRPSALCQRADRRLPRRRREARIGTSAREADERGARRIGHPAESRGAVPGSEAGRRSVAGRAYRRRRPRHQGAGAHRAGREARVGAGRAAGRVAAHLRQRLAADGAAGRQLGPDGRAQALRRARYLRRHPARRRHERGAHDRGDQQGRRRAHLRNRRLRHRRRSVRDRAGDDCRARRRPDRHVSTQRRKDAKNAFSSKKLPLRLCASAARHRR